MDLTTRLEVETLICNQTAVGADSVQAGVPSPSAVHLEVKDKGSLSAPCEVRCGLAIYIADALRIPPADR